MIAGSPLRLFRASGRGVAQLDRLERDEPVEHSSLIAALANAGAVMPIVTDIVRTYPTAVSVVTPRHVADSLRRPARSTATDDDASDPSDRRIVVDDGSPLPIAGAALRLEQNSGPGAARNAGLSLVADEFVAFVDDDVVAEDGWWDRLLGYFDDPNVAIVAPRVRSVAGPTVRERYECQHSPLDLGPVATRVQPGGRVSYVPSAALVCRVDALDAVGGFDEGLRVGEDVDLIWRLIAAGWAVYYDPSVEVFHRPRQSWADWARQRVRYGSSASGLDARHPGYARPAALNVWSAAAWGLVIAGHPITAVVTTMASASVLAARLAALPRTASFGLGVRGTATAGHQLAAAVRRAWWPLLALASPWSRFARRALFISVVEVIFDRGRDRDRERDRSTEQSFGDLEPNDRPRSESKRPGKPHGRSPQPVVASWFIRLADDLAYSVGVWSGVGRQRSLRALAPRLSGWPFHGAAGRGERVRG